MKITKGTNSIAIEFTDIEIKILENDLIGAIDYFEIAATEKLANCKSRLIKKWMIKFQNEKSVENIPTDEDLLLALIFSQSDYKNRVGRDATAEPLMPQTPPAPL